MSFRALVRPSAQLALRRAPAALALRRGLASEASGQALSEEQRRAQAFISERRHAEEHAGKSAELWRRVCLYICMPGLLVIGYHVYGIEAAHLAHRDHEYHENGNQVPERPKYEYLDIRKKPFPWGPNSLFFNPKANKDMSQEE